jgi:CheY-like chemotaxis protein
MITTEAPKPRIFIVENHEDTLRTLVRFLQAQGCEVRTAHSVAGALEQLAAWPPRSSSATWASPTATAGSS